MPDRSTHFFYKLPPATFILPAKEPQQRVIHPDMEELHCRSHIGHIPALIRPSAVDHILPYQHSQPVAMIIPSLRLYFHMLSDHIEPQFLHCTDIVYHRIVAGRRIQAFRPVSLVQHPFLEIRAVIQTDSWNAMAVFFDLYLSHGCITFYLVFPHRYFYIIQERILRAPAVHFF